MSEAQLTFSFRADLGNRAKQRQQIEAYCFQRGLKCEVYEQKSLLNSVFHFRVTGPDTQLREMKRDVENWFDTLRRFHDET